MNLESYQQMNLILCRVLHSLSRKMKVVPPCQYVLIFTAKNSAYSAFHKFMECLKINTYSKITEHCFFKLGLN
jgi:hypothetical protein